ncbi:MAG: outer membrane lipoprotein carrier protein LolA [Candidatus Tectomicrobia bacterium]|nr:outer membrane lipoprotein carrier protein LolA [Candidatus Tectomicrobia bacterium]
MILVAFPGLSAATPVETLLARVQQTYEQTRALSAEFVQVATLTTLNREQTSSGHMYIQKPHAIRWEYTHPASQTILYKDNTLQIYTPKRKQVLQSIIEEQDRNSVALLFLAGVGTLQQSFTITPLPSTEDILSRLRLVPRSPQAGFTELHITVNRQSAFIESLTIHDHIGNRTHIRFAALQSHPSLPAETFELILPPDTEILAQPGLSR